MSKVTPAPRKSAVAAGTVGLAAFGAIAGAVPAHAADTSIPLNANLSAVKGLLSHSTDGALALKSIPVVGSLLQGALPTDAMSLVQGADAVQPMTRSLPTAPLATVPLSAAAPSSSVLNLNTVEGLLPGNLDVARLDKNSLPLSGADSNSTNLPVLGSVTDTKGLLGGLL
jgi:hypothetical protein